MKLSRSAAAAIGVANVAASALAIAAPASATPDMTYISAPQVGTSPITAGGFQRLNGKAPQGVACASAYQSPNSADAYATICWTDRAGTVQTLGTSTPGAPFKASAAIWYLSTTVGSVSHGTRTAFDLAVQTESGSDLAIHTGRPRDREPHPEGWTTNRSSVFRGAVWVCRTER